MRILLVGDANSIFFVHYVKTLKKQMDVEVHVYSPIADRHDYFDFPYDNVYFDDYELKRRSRIRFVSWLYNPYVERHRFERFLKLCKEKYDIIHFHWIIPAWVIRPTTFRKYADKICVTLWGGEFESLHLLRSHRLYLSKLNGLFKSADVLIGSMSNKKLYDRFPILNTMSEYGIFGSSIIEMLSQMNETKDDCKRRLGIGADKITVVLGYSGKRLHNHDKIINKLSQCADFETFKKRLHFILPMSRGSENAYFDSLETLLNKHGCSYSMMKGYMSDGDVACLRKATDVMFQLSDFDGLSSSIKECLCANSIMIAGDWFPAYHTLKEAGFRYLEVSSLEEGVDVFCKVIDDLGSYFESFGENERLATKAYSWSECINDWVAVYRKLCPEK